MRPMRAIISALAHREEVPSGLLESLIGTGYLQKTLEDRPDVNQTKEFLDRKSLANIILSTRNLHSGKGEKMNQLTTRQVLSVLDAAHDIQRDWVLQASHLPSVPHQTPRRPMFQVGTPFGTVVSHYVPDRSRARTAEKRDAEATGAMIPPRFQPTFYLRPSRDLRTRMKDLYLDRKTGYQNMEAILHPTRKQKIDPVVY